jgi:3-oxoacyl-[acyl-carrier protein] reductase
MSHNLSGKVAVVTGASKGIGAGIAARLAMAGAAIIVNYAADRERAELVVAGIVAAGGRAIAVQADVSDPHDVERLFTESVRAFGLIDILVNNAGIFDGASLEAITPEHFHRLFEINVLGTILTTQGALGYFKPGGGSIVNISSDVSRLNPPGMGVYSASKAAVDSLTKTFAKELGGRNIRVNAVNPGPIETDGVRARGAVEQFRLLGKQRSLQRVGSTDDVTPLVAFLASDDAAWITGESYYVTGGIS